jgi:hypothetical protein
VRMSAGTESSGSWAAAIPFSLLSDCRIARRNQASVQPGKENNGEQPPREQPHDRRMKVGWQ